MTDEREALLALADADEMGWLIELPWTAINGGRLCWVALSGEPWPKFRTLPVDRLLEYRTPLRFVVDSNEALRFGRKEDAEAFMRQFDQFLMHAVATEHRWHAPALRARAEETHHE